MRFFRIAGVIVLAALAVGLGGAIFQSGYLAGVAADGGAPVVMAPGYGWGFGWGFGGGLFHLLGTFFFILLFIGILRAILGGRHRREWGGGPRAGWGRGGWGPGGPDGGHRFGPWEDRAREVHDAWHRREAAGETGTSASSAGTSSAGPTTGGGAA